MAAEPIGPFCTLAEFVERLERTEVLAAIRHRQDAARRLPPLADGRRDPWQLRPKDGAA